MRSKMSPIWEEAEEVGRLRREGRIDPVVVSVEREEVEAQERW